MWQVTGSNKHRPAVLRPLTGSRLTRSFGDGTVNGRSGCGTSSVPSTRAGNRLAIGTLASTRIPCADEGVDRQEQESLAALKAATRRALRDGVPDLPRADHDRVLTASSVAR